MEVDASKGVGIVKNSVFFQSLFKLCLETLAKLTVFG